MEIPDRTVAGDIINGVVNPNYSDFQDKTDTDAQHELVGANFERFDLVDVGDSRGFLLPGDLVELS